ncbi:DNA ligase LigA-related protein [Methylocucumis oryzae]|uniref:DNA ligase LigA-related protein n=1 Tax=Methylocucumis oryzae TaxID=1632867 RepID=UPI0023BB0B19|nr:hypothetical protein [Methylocucumis oryzae]
MSKPGVNEHYQQLIQKLNEWDYQYYILDNPSVSDAYYDQIFRELLELEQQYPELVTPTSPSQRVGATPIEEFRKIEHTSKMLSLANAFFLRRNL